MKQKAKWALALLAAAGFQMAHGEQAASTGAAASTPWYETLNIKGDMRYRFEDFQTQDKMSYERDRIRARVGFYPKINDDVDVGIRMTTAQSVSGAPGQGNPVSGNQNLTWEDSRKGVYLDAAYFDWHPSILPGLDLIGGKMAKNPLIQEGTYMWDPDLGPEGLAAKYHLDVADQFQVLVNGTYQWLNEYTTIKSEKMYAGQLALKFMPTKDSYVMVGATYYDFANLQGEPLLDWQNVNNPYGNSTTKQISGSTTNLVYADAFKVAEGFAEVGFDVGLPVRLYTSYLKNTEASANNAAYTAGLEIGKLGAPGTYLIGYDYRNVAKDSIPGMLEDDDAFSGSGTDGKGSKIWASYQILKNWQLDLTCWLTKKNIASGETPVDFRHMMVDLMAKF